MRGRGKPILVGLLALALLLSQLIGLRYGPTSSSARASSNGSTTITTSAASYDSTTGPSSSHSNVVANADTDTNTPIPSSTNTVVPSATSSPIAGSPTSSPTVGSPTSSPTVGSPTATFIPTITGTVQPGASLTIIPSTGPVSTTVTITAPIGTFPHNVPLNIYFTDPLPGSAPVLISSTAASDSNGGFTGSVTLPASSTPGYATITVTAPSTGATISGTYIVQTSLIASPNTVLPGGTIQLTGDGFAALNNISFSFNGTAITPANAPIKSDQHGHFVATVTVPATQALGLVGISATDLVHSASVNVTVGAAAGTATTTATVTLTPVSGTPTLLPTAPPLRSPTPRIPSTPTSVPTGPTGPAVTRASFAEGYTGLAKTNGKATFAEVLDILNANPSPASVTITYYVQGTTRPLIVTRSVRASSTLAESVNADVGPDKLVAAVVTSPQHIHVVRTITRTAANGARLDGSTTQASTPATSMSFAEGYTGVSFQEYLTLLNTSTTSARVSVVLAPQQGATVSAGSAAPASRASAVRGRTLSFTVPALSRATENIRSLNTGNTSNSVGMIISSTVPVVAERVEYFGDGDGSGKFGSTVTGGLPGAASQLRIGYGVSGGATRGANGKLQPVGDQDFVTLLNPSTGGAAAHVTVGFSDAASHGIGQPVTVDVPAGTRQTVSANTITGTRPVGPFSVSLSVSNGSVQAESAQYYGGSPNVGTHPGVALPALTAPLTDLFFSDLATKLPDGTAVSRGVYLYNPNGNAETVAATYFGSTGVLAHATYAIPAGGIATVNVNHALPVTVPAGTIGAEFKVSSGSFTAYAIGRTSDNRVALEEVGVSAP